jgi:uncharacterized protein (DUF2252 family)
MPRAEEDIMSSAVDPGAFDHYPEPTAAESLPEIAYHPWESPKERAARGKDARKRSPRSSHASWDLTPDRPDPIDLLEEQAAERAPDLVPIRYGRMAASAFAFYRGGALIMAHDLASMPGSGFNTQLCGDAHLMNFGLFESPERRLVFDINDFDETHPGPWEWDLKRLAASFEVAGRDRGFPTATRTTIVLTCARAYREAMLELSTDRVIDVWYRQLTEDTIRAAISTLDSKDARLVERDLSSATGKDNLRALSRLTNEADGTLRFRSAPPLLVPTDELLVGEERGHFKSAMKMALRGYRSSLPHERHHLYDNYQFHEIARKVVGVGSVGTRAWVLLFTGRDLRDPLFLQAKQAQASVLERFVGRSRYRNSGRRVVEGQKIMQCTHDILLGWYHVIGFDGRPYDFYVRQLWDGKGAFSVEAMDPSAWPRYAGACAWTLARAHARTGDHIAIASYLGTGDVFDRAIVEFAAAYAEQNQRDYDELLAAIANGRVTAITGV